MRVRIALLRVALIVIMLVSVILTLPTVEFHARGEISSILEYTGWAIVFTLWVVGPHLLLGLSLVWLRSRLGQLVAVVGAAGVATTGLLMYHQGLPAFLDELRDFEFLVVPVYQYSGAYLVARGMWQ